MNSQFSNEEREESKITFEPEPYEVTKPLEWLIQSIQANQQ